jgi:hypothetical protein
LHGQKVVFEKQDKPFPSNLVSRSLTIYLLVPWLWKETNERDQIVTDENDLEHKLTEVWENRSGDPFQSLFDEWLPRLAWMREHEKEYHGIGTNYTGVAFTALFHSPCHETANFLERISQHKE